MGKEGTLGRRTVFIPDHTVDFHDVSLRGRQAVKYARMRLDLMKSNLDERQVTFTVQLTEVLVNMCPHLEAQPAPDVAPVGRKTGKGKSMAKPKVIVVPSFSVELDPARDPT